MKVSSEGLNSYRVVVINDELTLLVTGCVSAPVKPTVTLGGFSRRSLSRRQHVAVRRRAQAP